MTLSLRFSSSGTNTSSNFSPTSPDTKLSSMLSLAFLVHFRVSEETSCSFAGSLAADLISLLHEPQPCEILLKRLVEKTELPYCFQPGSTMLFGQKSKFKKNFAGTLPHQGQDIKEKVVFKYRPFNAISPRTSRSL